MGTTPGRTLPPQVLDTQSRDNHHASHVTPIRTNDMHTKTTWCALCASTQGAERDAALTELVAVYDMHSLYNTAVRIKKTYPEETVLTVTADEDVPFTLVAEVVHAVRDTRDAGNAKGYFADDAAFEAAAPPARSFTSGGGLFSDPVFGIVQ